MATMDSRGAMRRCALMRLEAVREDETVINKHESETRDGNPSLQLEVL